MICFMSHEKGIFFVWSISQMIHSWGTGHGMWVGAAHMGRIALRSCFAFVEGTGQIPHDCVYVGNS